MNDDDIHKMMDRAHYAEIREQRLRIEVDRLKAENERLRRDAAGRSRTDLARRIMGDDQRGCAEGE